MSESRVIETVLTDDHAGLRLDQALTEALGEFSRATVQSWIKSGGAEVDGSRKKPTYKVLGGEVVRLTAEFQANERWLPEQLSVDVIHADDDLIIIDKPAGLVVHPGAGNSTGTLINGLLAVYPELASLPRCGIVHRIDKDTSGLLVVARSARAHRQLVDQLSRHEVAREYLAIAQGQLISGGTVDAPIGRDPRHRIRMAVVDSGRHAITHYRVEQRFNSYTLLSVSLETGRTHQIRVHMAHLHHPLLGDPLYGGRSKLPGGVSEALRKRVQSFERQALHAKRLSLRHPGNGETVTWESSVPDDLQQMIDHLAEEDSLQ
ncbi:MAG: 23S rRNA pseudouridine(1911/1915/1917) synthase RluD [Gammaproteobacteria bacterium]